MRTDWPIEIRDELEKAQKARARGNEGQARVCARRAAGMAARLYLARRGEQFRSPSAYDLLQLVSEDLLLPADIRETAARLTLRVNQQFRLPAGMDLIAEAQRLCNALLNEPSP